MKGTPLGSVPRRAAAGSIAITVAMAVGGGHAGANVVVENLRPDGRGSLLAAMEGAGKTPGTDKITFARRLRGTIHLRPRVVNLESPVVVKGRGYGRRGTGRFGRVVIAGSKRGTTFRVAGTDENYVFRQLNMKGVGVFASEAEAKIRDSYLDGRSTLTGSVGVEGSSFTGAAVSP